ncbi:Virulence sensor protein BvgS [compost metagenome]
MVGWFRQKPVIAIGLFLGVFCSAIPAKENIPSWTPLDLLARPAGERVEVELPEADWQWLRARKVLVVGTTSPDYPPLETTPSGKELEGVTADYLGILESALNIRIQVRRYSGRNSAIQALQKGEIDLLGRSTRYESEFPGIVLSVPYFANQPVVVGRKDVPPDDGDRLSGRRIAVVDDYFSREEIARHYPRSGIVRFDSIRRALEAVSFGRADFYVGDAFSAQYIISQGYLLNLRMLNFARFDGGGFSFALAASNDRLRGILDKALESVPVPTSLVIQRRWGTGVPYSIAGSELVLTDQERRWLERHPRPVLVVDQALAPLTFFDSDRQFHGIVADLLDLVRARTGLQFEVQPSVSIPDMLKSVREGHADVIAALAPTHERQELLAFSRPYLDTSFVVVTRKASDRIGDLADLDNQAVAVSRGSQLIDYFREHYPHVRVVEVENNADALLLLSDGQVDAAIHVMASATFLLSRYYRNLRIVATLDPEPGNLSFAVSRAEPELLSILNKALLAISPEEMANLVSRWSATAESSDSVWEAYRTQLYQLAVAGALALALVLFWNWRLQRKVRQRSLSEKDLSYRLAFKRALVDGIPHPVVVRDRKGRLLTCNRSYLEFTGLTREAAQGTCVTDYSWLNPRDAEALQREFLQVLERGEPQTFDRVMQVHGQTREGHLWITPYRNVKGEVLGLVCGWIDVTERERLHQQLQIAKEQAEEASRIKSTFLATMSHEIRTPLSAVIGMLELALLGSGCGSCSQSGPLEVAHESARSLLLLIGDILDVAKIESGRLTLMPERARLRELVESVARIFDGLARQKGLQLRLEIDVEAAACDVLIDPLRFKQILSNLLSNAIKFTDRGFVGIQVAADPLAEDRIALDLCVEDSGIGIAEEDQARLFEPFSQVQQGSFASRGGTGLGLNICRKLAEMMGGTVRLESTPGAGTRVRVSLVLHTLEPLPEQVAKRDAVAEMPGCSLRVLVVDDHPANRMLLSQQLEHLGQQVVLAEDGAQALQAWSPGEFDLVITDCNMPVLNGYELAMQIRQSERESGAAPCRIFGFTANAQPDEIERCRSAGMDDCLFKPLSLEQLRSHLVQVPRIAAAETILASDAGIEIQALEEMTGGDPALTRQLVEELYRTNQADVAQLEALLRKRDWPQLAELAHRIKGAARMVQAELLQERCVELENACRNGPGESDLQLRVRHVREAAERLQAQLQTYLDMLPGSCPEAPGRCNGWKNDGPFCN